MRVCQMKYRNRGDSTQSCADERASALPEKADYSQRKSLISSVPLPDVPWPALTKPSGRRGLAGVHAHCTTSRGPARDAGNAHRRKGTADDSLCGGDEAVHAWNLRALADFQADGADDYRQQANTDAL